ncbi:serine hydrolase [Flagellimonas sp. S174]|uniref:serine hydrolase n=1 Tax=Flagellimonas sp. S174 TaxID=3410790 RepID=UPI003BF53A05
MKILLKLVSFFLLMQSVAVFPQNDDFYHLKAIEKYIDDQMELHGIPSLALGILRNDSIVFEGYYGKTSKGLPIDNKTVFGTFGITKLVVVTAIFKLINEEKLHLADNLYKYLNDIPNSWKKIQIKHILGNSSGIHSVLGFGVNESNRMFFERIGKLPLEFVPGEKYEFNAINYWLLGKLIETISGQALEEYFWKNVLGGNGADFWFTTYLSPNSGKGAYFEGYNPWENGHLNVIDRAYARDQASDGLNSTLPRLMNWAKKLQAHSYFPEKTKLKMWSSFVYSNDDVPFLHGWYVYSTNQKDSYGISGSRTALRIFPEQDLTLILMTNGYQYYPIQKEIVNTIAGMLAPELKDTQELLFYDLSNALVQHKGSNADALIKKVKEEIPENEWEQYLIALGNKALGLDNKMAARLFFEVNTQEFPNSVNAFENLTKFYLNQRLIEEARSSLKRVLELDPNHKWAKKFPY